MSRASEQEILSSILRLRRLRLITRMLREEGIVAENFGIVIGLADALLDSLKMCSF